MKKKITLTSSVFSFIAFLMIWNSSALLRYSLYHINKTKIRIFERKEKILNKKNKLDPSSRFFDFFKFANLSLFFS